MPSKNRYLKHTLAGLLILPLMAAQAASAAPAGEPSRSSGRGAAAVSDDPPLRLGDALTVDGTTYTPVDTLNYDQVGYAGIIAGGQDGAVTALGEPFNPAIVSGVSKTLPMPSYVEVTSLDTGRTILVRINDRGPRSNERLIDLSSAAAAQLGIAEGGVARVRVRRVNPPEQERSTLRGGGLAAERLSTPKPLLNVLSQRLAGQPRPRATIVTAVDHALAPPVASLPVRAVPARQPVATPSLPTLALTPEGAGPDAPSYADTPGTTYAPPPLAGAAPKPVKPVPLVVKPKPAPIPVSPPAAADYPVDRPGTTYAPPPLASNRPANPPPARQSGGGSSQPATGAPGGFVVQIGSFSSQERADALARALRAYVAVGSDDVWRVRYGPYPTAKAAQAGVASAAAQGYSGARVMVNDAAP